MKTITCKDAGFQCDYVVRGETEDEVMRNGVEHAMIDHHLKEKDITPEFKEKLKSLIRTENVSKIITMDDVQQKFLDSMYKFGVQLENLTEDMKAIEVVTAIGPTTIDVISSNSDITNMANGKGKITEGNKLTILARTRFELDGDLLVILPTKGSLLSSSAGGQDGANTNAGQNLSDKVEIDIEMLNLHKENVNMALQNLQFVYGKVMDIATKLAESNTGFFDRFRIK